jgi:hypothetical protein
VTPITEADDARAVWADDPGLVALIQVCGPTRSRGGVLVLAMVTPCRLKCSSANRCHHLLKTFWGWRDQQPPDGTGNRPPVNAAKK